MSATLPRRQPHVEFNKGDTGTGTVTLANDLNSHTGATTISRGTLNVATIWNGGFASAIGVSTAASANLVISGQGTLNYTGLGAATSDRGFTLVREGGTAGTINIADGAANLTFTGVVTSPDGAGPGSLVENGGYSQGLTNCNSSYDGGTTINAGCGPEEGPEQGAALYHAIATKCRGDLIRPPRRKSESAQELFPQSLRGI